MARSINDRKLNFNLLKERKKARLTLVGLQKKIKVTSGYLNRIERNRDSMIGTAVYDKLNKFFKKGKYNPKNKRKAK